MSVQTQEVLELSVETLLLNDIVIYNDDVNTFEHVIESLVDVLDHTNQQAEQCAWIIHTKGKCKVKKGSYEELIPLCSAILDRGISAEIN
ncbi:MAG: ATP-dependent Clp protease adaptor ClpS [Bacteroidota bacterium]|nr:ATP-dependent Clp protease adaptor ClpS [Bacteroidota bacterium]